MPPKAQTDLSKQSDDWLFDSLREQVNIARNNPKGYDRGLVRALGAEMRKRGILDAAQPYASTIKEGKN